MRVLTVSEYSRAELVRYGIAPAERIRVIHNGVDHGQPLTPDQSIVARLGLVPGHYVLALASTQAHKNINVLLDAFSKYSLPGLKLVLFGSAGPAQFAAAGMNTSESVVFTGRVSDSELTALMETALCFATPSLTEGFGLPPLEAMALGCPAVVSPCGALPEVCGDGALYVAPDRTDHWRGAFLQLSEDRQLRSAMVARGRQQASIMTWARAGDQLMEVLRDVASGLHA